jgi:maleylacetate reductase
VRWSGPSPVAFVAGEWLGSGFAVAAMPTRVVFGRGTVGGLPEEVERAGLSRVLVLSTPGRAALAKRVGAALGERSAGVHPRAAMHVPHEVVETCRRAARESGASGCVAVGGGSTIGLAKAVALQDPLPYLAIPTTYSGSEMTPVWGVTRAGEKHTGRAERVRAATVVYDVDLTLGLPVRTSVASGINALAHAVEALYAENSSPIVDLMAGQGVDAVVHGLPGVVDEPSDSDARAQALYGAWLCGCCLGATTMGLHHQLCHLLGGAFGLPHAETHSVLLPYSLAHNASRAPKAMTVLADALGTDEPVTKLWRWSRRLGTPRSLAELGLTQGDIDPVVEAATRDPYPNPVAVQPDAVRALLHAALQGAPPLAPGG